ncbi:MAG: 3-phosphoshikimate 1-carboxyvinyltransferase [Candidatus Helarchaeota archaeon]
MVDIEVLNTSRLTGKIRAPPSKSYTHRAIIMGSLAQGISTIRSPLLGNDTLASIRAMQALGARILKKNNNLIIEGIKQFKVPDKTINVENSGTTIRFLTAISAHVPGTIRLTGDESIQRRPMGPLLDALNHLGIKCISESNDGTPPLVITGGNFKGGSVSIPGNISSQFISGLLIAAPLASSDVTIQLTTPLKSRPYLSITSEMLKQFGIQHTYNSQLRRYHIPGQQKYRPIDYTIPGDFSSAAFFLGAAAFLQAEISISNLDIETAQGDKEILNLLKIIGATVIINPTEKIVTVKSHKLKPFKVDVGDIPDLVPILAVIASFIPGQSELFNAAHLRIKESDRLHTLSFELRKMGITVEELKDALIITGTPEHQSATLESHNDHRIAMALIMAALPLKGKSLIRNIDCITVSYPNFLNDLKKLGGNFRVINT